MVLLLDGSSPTEAIAAQPVSLAAEVDALIAQGLSEKDALKQVARNRSIGKSDAYREYQRGQSRRR
jgi:16S rRNA (cytidine1402-2'-O)-methyltransferase